MRTFNRREVLRAAVLGAGGLVSCDRVVTGMNREVFGEGVPVRGGMRRFICCRGRGLGRGRGMWSG